MDGTGLIAVQTLGLHAPRVTSLVRCALNFAFYSIGKVRKTGLGDGRHPHRQVRDEQRLTLDRDRFTVLLQAPDV